MKGNRQSGWSRLLPAVVVVGTGCLALGQDGSLSGLYLRGGPGVSLLSDTELTEYPRVAIPSGVDVEFDTGFAFAAVVGYEVNSWFAAEFETGFTYNSVDSIGGLDPDGDASLSQLPMLVNLVFQYRNGNKLVPFAGAGVGGSLQTASFDEYGGISTGGGLDGSDSDVVFTWQGFAGLRYEFNDNMAVGATYRYMMADGPDWDVDTGFQDEPLAIDDVESHTITAQFTYRF